MKYTSSYISLSPTHSYCVRADHLILGVHVLQGGEECVRVDEDLLRHQVLVLQVLPHKVHREEEEDDDKDHRKTLEDETGLVMVVNDCKNGVAQQDHDIANGDVQAPRGEVEHH